MFKSFSFPYKASILLSSLMLAAAALTIILKNFGNSILYGDFIVGYLAWGAETKSQDLIALPAFIFAFVFFTLYLIWLIHRLELLFDKEISGKFVDQLLLWCLPAVAAVGGLLLGKNFDKQMLTISVVGILVNIIAASLAAYKRRVVIDPINVGLYLFSIMTFALIPLEVVLVFGRLAPINLLSVINENILLVLKCSYVLVTFGIFTFSVFIFSEIEASENFLSKLLFISQLFLVSFFFVLYPAKIETSTGEIFQYPTTAIFLGVLIALILWGLQDVVKRYNQYNNSTHINISHIVSPVAIVALLIAVKFGITIPPHISPDDYHYGEHLLGFFSYLHGAIPYVDFIPPHGFVDDDLTALISNLFIDGKAGSLDEAGRLTYALLSVMAFYCLYRSTNSLTLAFVCVLFLGGRLTWPFLVPFFCLWFFSSLKDNPPRWILAWIITAPIVVLGTPTQGIMLVLASAPLFISLSLKIFYSDMRNEFFKLNLTIFICCGFFLIFFFTPLISMLRGIFRYILENGAANEMAYGITWSLSWNGAAQSGLVFEMARMSWIVGPIISLFIIFSEVQKHRRFTFIVATACAVLIFSFLLIPYTMGRIDPGALSRPGLAAIFMWCILIPLILRPLLSILSNRLLLLCIAFIGAALTLTPATYPALSSSYKSLSYTHIAAVTSAKIASPPLIDGKAFGLDNIGKASVDPTHLERLSKLKVILTKYLSKEDTYLDLTSRNAQYFYTDYVPVIPISAPYNMASTVQQQRALDVLSSKVPKLILLEGNNITHDGGGLALRNPLIFRFVVENYVPFFEDGFIFAVKKGSKEAEQIKDKIYVSIKDFTDSNWLKGINRAEPAVIVTNHPVLFALPMGTVVKFSNGEERKIVRMWGAGNAIWFDGLPFDSEVFDKDKNLVFFIDELTENRINTELLEIAMTTKSLAGIPIAWGKSETKLNSKMKTVIDFNVAPTFSNLIASNDVFLLDGADPQLIYLFYNKTISGWDAGVLKFKFTCIDKVMAPSLQIFWWGDDEAGPSEASSVHLSADNGILIVPLDVSVRWLKIKKLKAIRIDLDNSASCKAIKIENISLNQRNVFVN